MLNIDKRIALCQTAARLFVVAVLLLCGCSTMFSTNIDGVVDMNSREVSERDIEVAKQLNVSDQMLESLERGEWPTLSDRDFVRYAELAIDYMRDTYGQNCRAKFTDIPWLLSHEATAHLVVVGGEYDGAEVSVTISASEPRTYSDSWTAVTDADEFEQLVNSALSEAFSELPEGSWAVSTSTDSYYMNDGRFGGIAVIFISLSAVPTEESLGQTITSLEEALEATGAGVDYHIVVPSVDPPDSIMTVEYGREAAKESGSAVAHRLSGKVGLGGE